MKNRAFVLWVCVVLTLALLAGCGRQVEAAPSVQPESPAALEKSPTPETETEADVQNGGDVETDRDAGPMTAEPPGETADENSVTPAAEPETEAPAEAGSADAAGGPWPEEAGEGALDPEERVGWDGGPAAQENHGEGAPQSDAETETEPAPVLPTVTKSPTDETVEEGGSCLFLAGYENAELAVWHFVSPDGQTDMTYEAAQTAFPSMEIRNGMFSNLQLSNIPYALNGWRVYCQYSNPGVGYVNTETARITVIAEQGGQNQAGTGAAAVSGNVSFHGYWVRELDPERCQIVMNWVGDGSYQVFVAWATGQMVRSVWSMTATPAGADRLEYRGGDYWVETYESDGSYTVSDQRTGEAGTFFFDGGGRLIWDDVVMGELVFVRPQ